MTLKEKIEGLINSGEVINEQGNVCHSSLQVFSKCWTNRLNRTMWDLGYHPVLDRKGFVEEWSKAGTDYLIQLGDDEPIASSFECLNACKVEATKMARVGAGDIKIVDAKTKKVISQRLYHYGADGFGWGGWIKGD